MYIPKDSFEILKNILANDTLTHGDIRTIKNILMTIYKTNSHENTIAIIQILYNILCKWNVDNNLLYARTIVSSMEKHPYVMSG